MADRYISSEWLLKALSEYKDIREKWSTKVCDPDTILRVLHVVENLVNIAPNIGPIQYRREKLEAIGLALKSRLDLLKEQLRYDEQNRDIAGLLVGAAEEKFYAGRCEATKEEIGWLERMVRDG